MSAALARAYAAVLALAAAKAVASLVATVAVAVPTRAAASQVIPLQVVCFGAVGAYLTLGGRRDRRAALLGGFLLIVASSFADSILVRASSVLEPGVPATSVALLRRLYPDAFLALSLWLFVRVFPAIRTAERRTRIEDVAVWTCGIVGVVLFVASMLPADAFGSGALAMLSRLQRSPRGTLYWPLVFALAAPALLVAVRNALRAQQPERRRFAVFICAIAVGFLPMAIAVIAESTSSSFAQFIRRGPNRTLVGFVLYPLLLLIPVMTAYAVTVDQVLSVRFIVRAGLRYALARYSIVALAVASIVVATASIISHRADSIQSLMSGPHRADVLGPLLVAIVLLTSRRPLMKAIDRWFFKEHVDARRLLVKAAERDATPGSLQDECASVASVITGTLRLMRTVVLLVDPTRSLLYSAASELRPLPLSAQVARLALQGSRPWMRVDLDSMWRGRRFPHNERSWLADAGAHALVPLRTPNGPVGCLVLGSKIDDMPFTRDELDAVSLLSAAEAIRLEALAARPERAIAQADVRDIVASLSAGVCSRCGRVQAADTACGACGGATVSGTMPLVLAGKFQLQRRIGAGGMGVVYEAVDLDLQRSVALKTLPRVSPEACVRLRREGRAMAACAHPHLATIFGLETWQGTPALVIEYLPGGTLRDRLRGGKVAPRELVGMAAALGGALAALHDAGLVHGDIKPSNVGFTAAGAAKLLDFGLAQLLDHADTAAPSSAGMFVSEFERAGTFAGTPAYAAPETVGGGGVDAAADVWSLGLVMFEALTGSNPFAGTTVATVSRRIGGRLPRLRDLAPNCPDALARLIDSMVTIAPRDRPSAAVVREQLVSIATATSAAAAV